MRLRDGALVVFEGLDAAGKSTQVDNFLRLPGWLPVPSRLHMPSGHSALTNGVYRLLEQRGVASGLARQLFHLACHAENTEAVQRSRAQGLVLDRWWWSTVAYSRELSKVDRAMIDAVIDRVWAGVSADLVVCFLHAFREDPQNADGVAEAYRDLVGAAGDDAVVLSPADPDTRSRRLVDVLRDRGLLVG